jgi:2-hydroxychromene-2-carboxylate isomerase
MRLRFLAVLLALTMAAGAGAQPNPAQPAKKDKPKAAAVKKGVRPAWAELTAEQQAILAPLKNDWDTLEPERRQKWIGIAKRYPRMKPLEQERVQRRMQMWANLSPEQRRQARESYKQLAKSKRPANKDLRQAWAEYQALPPQERESLVPRPSTDPRRPKHTN